jgi:hypothetical protein
MPASWLARCFHQDINEPNQKDRIIEELREENRLLRQKVDQLLKIIHGIKSEWSGAT